MRRRPTRPTPRIRATPSNLAAYGNLAFFRARAAQANADAEAATLDHVRERCRRSQAAWMALADKAEQSERMRAQEQIRKAEAGLTS
jgi:hypothetical protein